MLCIKFNNQTTAMSTDTKQMCTVN